MTYKSNGWKYSNPQVFWGEIAPRSHVVQFYEDNEAFLVLLEDFIINGIKTGDGVIIIATAEHLLNMYNRLTERGFDVDALRNDDQYIPVNADDALSQFMVNGWPDEQLFQRMVNELLKRAQRDKRKVRAFGEMVATLWAKGDCGATVHLEHLWDNFCKEQVFCLFCAYPKSGFTQSSDISMNNICCSHSLMIKEGNTKSQISYINVDQKKFSE
jgi:hypothetical protein